ncbi:hypothetical protein K440DRAFT_615863 [Wilcoxina mikolae CBS 423.85]|nr:hypothetical protein K440DRAFT_615863 [Wilcoxina mikolae CBS 423.85]
MPLRCRFIVKVIGKSMAFAIISISVAGAQVPSQGSVYGRIVVMIVLCTAEQNGGQGTWGKRVDFDFPRVRVGC